MLGLCVPALALMSCHLFLDSFLFEDHRADEEAFCQVHSICSFCMKRIAFCSC